jgi:hypothetical protein
VGTLDNRALIRRYAQPTTTSDHQLQSRILEFILDFVPVGRGVIVSRAA